MQFFAERLGRRNLVGALPRILGLVRLAKFVVNVATLLPAFPGLEAWKQAHEYGVRVTGCTVHLVDHGIDTGPILAQGVVPALEEDTPETLHRRIQEEEHELYPRTLARLFNGEIRIGQPV